jgi:hypothetical protein
MKDNFRKFNNTYTYLDSLPELHESQCLILPRYLEEKRLTSARNRALRRYGKYLSIPELVACIIKDDELKSVGIDLNWFKYHKTPPIIGGVYYYIRATNWPATLTEYCYTLKLKNYAKRR